MLYTWSQLCFKEADAIFSKHYVYAFVKTGTILGIQQGCIYYIEFRIEAG
jgi:hypothetical protein